MQDRTLVQRRPQSPVQPVFEIQLAVPANHVREKVTIERRVLGQDAMQVKHVLGGNELVQPDRTRRDLSPFARSPGMIWIGSPLPDLLEYHKAESR